MPANYRYDYPTNTRPMFSKNFYLPGGGTINAHGKIVVAFARFEFARIVVGGHVPVAAHD